MTIPTLPDCPSASNSSTFPLLAENFAAALQPWAVEVQAVGDAAEAARVQCIATVLAATSSDQYGTSVTSVTISTGSKVLTTQSAKRWVPGQRLRISDSTGANWMDGYVTAYATTSLTLTIDLVGGTGTIASWNISPAGVIGPNTLVNTDISGAKVVGFFAEFNNGVSGTAKTITLSAGQKQKVSLTGNVTLTIDFTGALVGTYQLRMIQDATGSRTVTWAGLSASRWLGSTTAPAINTAASTETLVNIFYDGATAVQSVSKVGAP